MVSELWRTKARRLVPHAVFGVLIALAYGNALRNGYVWDDLHFFGDYTWVYSLKDAFEVAIQPLFGQRSYVRPLPLFMLLAEAVASERNPAVAHAVNLMLHWICTALVFIIAHRSSAALSVEKGCQFWLPFLLAAVFAVHPALSEAPIWVSSRFDLMATLLFLLAIWVASLRLTDIPRALLLGALYLLGALCKESVVVLPFFIAVHAMLRGTARRNDGRVNVMDAFNARELKSYAALLFAGLVYLLLRHLVLKGTDALALDLTSPVERLSRFTTATAQYLQLTVLPFAGSSPHHTWTWPDGGTLATYWRSHLITGAFLTVVTVLVARRAISGWWLLAWLVAYLPVLHLLPLPIGQNLIHQRFMYLPTAALLALAPYALAPIKLTPPARKMATGLVLIAIIASIPIDRSIVSVWRNDISLWTWTVRTSPDSTQARENLIFAYLDQGMYEEADKEFAEFVSREMSSSANLPVNLGAAKHRQEEFEDALYYYSIAEQHPETLTGPGRSRLLANIAITNATLGRPEDAKRYLLEALEANPRNRIAIGHLLGYCEGLEIDTSPLDMRDVNSATKVATATIELMNREQPALHADRAFCPFNTTEKNTHLGESVEVND